MSISRFMVFFANDLLLAVYFIFILDYGNDVRQKVNPQAIFLFQFKMDCKAAETTHNINNAFGSGTTNEVLCNGGSRSFAKGTSALKLRSIVASH